MNTRDEAIALINRINTEKSLYNFINRMVKNPTFREKKPNTHQFFKNLNDFRSTKGMLTDKQKIAINGEIRKNAEFFVTLRREVVVSVENTPDDDSLASAEADRHAAMDSE